MIVLVLLPALIVALYLWRGRRRRRYLRLSTPLAGFDTGVRSPWRTPGRRRPHRGF